MLMRGSYCTTQRPDFAITETEWDDQGVGRSYLTQQDRETEEADAKSGLFTLVCTVLDYGDELQLDSEKVLEIGRRLGLEPHEPEA